MTEREELIELLWGDAKEVLFITKDQYVWSLFGWEITPHEVEGVLAGITLTKGSEFHFVTLGEKWSLTRADVRRYLQPIIDSHGCVTTKTPKEDTRQSRFNKILGFVVTGEDEYYTHFKLEQLRHA